MTRLLLACHGHHDWVGRGIAGRLPQVHLSEAGQQEALALAIRLSREPLQAIYSSPQPRTRETAAPLAAALGLPVQPAPEFDEGDFGDWQGESFEQLERDHRDAWRHWVERRATSTPPGGEPFAEVQRRAVGGVERLCAAHPQGSVVVFSHGDVIKAVVAHYLGLSLDELERFDIAPASVTIILRGDGWAQLKLLSGTGL
jgi:probable phosphoglycerate mutase